MRLATIIAAALFFTMTAMPMAALAQRTGNDSCKSVCGCDELQCTDFCATNSCTTNSACKRRFQALVKQCQKACDRCVKLQKQRSTSQ